MRRRVRGWVALGTALACLLVLSASPASAAAVEPGTIMWGAYISGVPYKTVPLTKLENDVGRQMSIVHWGEPWMSNGQPQAFQRAWFEKVRLHGSIPMLTWGSWDASQGVNQPEFRTAAIANGAYDSYISQWARAARAWGQPFFLRFDNEMNGWWQFPWSDQTNGNQMGDFVRAWRHVHDIFVQEGATNVTWVWCPNLSGPQSTPLSQVYPGDSYVDWTCVDVYNYGTDGGNAWQSFSQLIGGADYGGSNPLDTYQQLVSLAPSKPIMIGELASSENGGSKAAWITDMLQTLPTTFPQIKAIVWSDWNGGDASVTWPLDSSASAMSAFASGIGNPAYAANQFRNLDTQTVQPLGGLPPLVPALSTTS